MKSIEMYTRNFLHHSIYLFASKKLVYFVAIFLFSSVNAHATDSLIEWNDEEESGATRMYYHSGLRLQWQRNMGDWTDKYGTHWGGAAFASRSITNKMQGHYIKLDVTTLVRRWALDGVYPGFFVRGRNGTIRFSSRESILYPPLLRLSWHGGGDTIESSRDAELNATTTRSLGKNKSLKVTSSTHGIIGFDFDQVIRGKEILSATLMLNVDKLYGSSALVNVFELGLRRETSNLESEINEQGLASEYKYDNGLKLNPDVFYFENFERRFSEKLWSAGKVRRIARKTSLPQSNRSMMLTIKEGTNSGNNSRYRFKTFSQDEPEEAYFRYYLRLDNSWITSSTGGKLPGFAGTYDRAGWGSRKPFISKEGWSARGAYRRPFFDQGSGKTYTPIGNYVYHLGQSGSYGDNWIWSLGDGAVLETERWYCVEQYVSLNDPGRSNGQIKAWLDGKLVFHRTGLKFRESKDINIQEVWFNVYHGGSARAPSDLTLSIDNVAIARSYIGPMGRFDNGMAGL